MIHDVLVVGGGPGGLSAALALGRARRRVLLCDSGPRRNAAAVHLQNFVTRDGTPPTEFRRLGRAELARYPNVTVQDAGVRAITGARGAFRVTLDDGEVTARRVLLATGMIDEPLAIPGFRELWGHAIFQCPYCHGWEVADRRWGYLVRAADAGHLVPFAVQARGWSADVTVFFDAPYSLAADAEATLARAGVKVESSPVARLVGGDGRLEAVELASGATIACDVLYAHPPQRQVDLVGALGLALDDLGMVKVDPMRGETSLAGIFAAGDLTSKMQGAILAAAAAARTAAMINVDLALDLDGA